MSDLSRREVVKLAAGLAVGAGGLVGGEARGDEKPALGISPATPQPGNDSALEYAQKNPSVFMFSEQVAFKLEGDGHSRDLVITSAQSPERKSGRVRVPSAAMRIFRADAGVDAFTREGGVYWQFHNKAGTFQFKEPGALVLIVREHDDTVRCYSLAYDERC